MLVGSSGGSRTTTLRRPSAEHSLPLSGTDVGNTVVSIVKSFLPEHVTRPVGGDESAPPVVEPITSPSHRTAEVAARTPQPVSGFHTSTPRESPDPGDVPKVRQPAFPTRSVFPGLPAHVASNAVAAAPSLPSAPPMASAVVALAAAFSLPSGVNPLNAPHVPAPFIELAWGLYRRFESVFCNHRPVAGRPEVSTSLNEDGEIVGDLNISDRDHDRLRYRVVDGPDPAKGAVAVNSDGTFTYTPTAEFASTGGTDTFTVVASDKNCLHFHGLASLFTPGHGHTAVQTVTVSLSPSDTTTTTPLYGTPVPDNRHGDYLIVSEYGSHAAVVTVDDENKYYVTVLRRNGSAGQPIPLTGNADYGPVVNHDGSLVVVPTTTEDGHHYITVVDTNTNSVARTIDLDALGYDGQSLSLSKDASKAAIVVYDDETGSSAVRVIDTSTGVASDPVLIEGNLMAIINDDGTKVVVPSNIVVAPGNSNFYLTVIDTTTNTAGPRIPFTTSPQVPFARPFVSEDGTRAIGGIQELSTPKKFWAVPINLESGTTTGPFAEAGAPVSDFYLSDDGSRAVRVTQDGPSRYVTIYDLHTGSAAAPIDVGTVGVGNSVGISADGTRAAAPGYDSSDGQFKMLVFDTTDNTYVAVSLQANAVGRPALSANGDRVYTAAVDTEGNPVLLTIDTTTGTVVKTEALSGQPADSAALTEDGSRVYVLTTHEDGKYYVDSFATGAAPITV